MRSFTFALIGALAFTAHVHAALLLNEVADKGSTGTCGGADWIELCNTDTQNTLSLDGAIMFDSKGQSDPDAKTFTSADTIAANTCSVYCKGTDFDFGIGGDDTVSITLGGVSLTTGQLLDQGAVDKTWNLQTSDSTYAYGTATPGLLINNFDLPTAAPTQLQTSYPTNAPAPAPPVETASTCASIKTAYITVDPTTGASCCSNDGAGSTSVLSCPLHYQTQTCARTKAAWQESGCCSDASVQVPITEACACRVDWQSAPCTQVGGYPSVEDVTHPDRYQSVDSGTVTPSGRLYVYDDVTQKIKMYKSMYGTDAFVAQVITDTSLTKYSASNVVESTEAHPFGENFQFGADPMESFINLVAGSGEELFVHIYNSGTGSQTIFRRADPSSPFVQIIQDTDGSLWSKKMHSIAVVDETTMVGCGSDGYVAKWHYAGASQGTMDGTFGTQNGSPGQIDVCAQPDPRSTATPKALMSARPCGTQKSITVDEDGWIYTANKDDGSIAVFDTNGVLRNTFSGNTLYGTGDVGTLMGLPANADRTFEQLEGVGYICGRVVGRDESGGRFLAFDTADRANPSKTSLDSFKGTWGSAGSEPSQQSNADEFIMMNGAMVIFDKENFRTSIHSLGDSCDALAHSDVHVPEATDANVVAPLIVFGDRLASGPYHHGVTISSPNEMTFLSSVSAFPGALAASDTDANFYEFWSIPEDTSLKSSQDTRLPAGDGTQAYRSHYIGWVGGSYPGTAREDGKFASTAASGGKKGPESAVQIGTTLLVVDRGGAGLLAFDVSQVSAAYAASTDETYVDVPLFNSKSTLTDPNPTSPEKWVDITGLEYDVLGGTEAQCQDGGANLYIADQQTDMVHAYKYDSAQHTLVKVRTLPRFWGTSVGTYPDTWYAGQPSLAGTKILRKTETLTITTLTAGGRRLIATSEDQQLAWTYDPCTNTWDTKPTGGPQVGILPQQSKYVADIEGVGVDYQHRVLVSSDEDNGRVNLQHTCDIVALGDKDKHHGAIACFVGASRGAPADCDAKSPMSGFGWKTQTSLLEQQYGTHISHDGIRVSPNGEYIVVADQKNKRMQVYTTDSVGRATNYNYARDPCMPLLQGTALNASLFEKIYVIAGDNTGSPVDNLIIRNDNDVPVNIKGIHVDDSSSLTDLTMTNDCIIPPHGTWALYEDESYSRTFTANGRQREVCTGSFGSGLSGGGETIYLAYGDDVKTVELQAASDNKQPGEAELFDNGGNHIAFMSGDDLHDAVYSSSCADGLCE